MFRPAIPTLLLFTFSCCISSCKKDLLHPQKVQQLNSGTSNRLNKIRYLGNNIFLAAGGSTFDNSVVVRSIDGGFSWTATQVTSAPKEMYGMDVAPDGTVYLSGIDGDILSSTDSGNSWIFNRIGNWLSYRGGRFATPDTGIFVSTVLQRQCTITRVDAEYKIIDEQTYMLGANNLYMTTADTGYMVGYGAVMKTNNRGNTWKFQDIKGDNFTSMDIHGNEIWLCGAAGSVFHTTDGGEHWKTLRDGNSLTLPKYYLRCILFRDSQYGWAAGDDGALIHSDDGGKHWMKYQKFTDSKITSITYCPNGDLMVAGDHGILYRITP